MVPLKAQPEELCPLSRGQRDKAIRTFWEVSQEGDIHVKSGDRVCLWQSWPLLCAHTHIHDSPLKMLLVKYFPRAKNESDNNIPIPKYQTTIFKFARFDMDFWFLKVHLERKSCKEVTWKVSAPDLSLPFHFRVKLMDTNCLCSPIFKRKYSFLSGSTTADPTQECKEKFLNSSFTFGIFYIQEDSHCSVCNSSVIISHILWLNGQGRALHARVLLWEKCDYLNLYSEPAPGHCWCRTSVITFLLHFPSVISLVMTFPVTPHQCSFTGILKKETKPTQISRNLSLHWHPPGTGDGWSSGTALMSRDRLTQLCVRLGSTKQWRKCKTQPTMELLVQTPSGWRPCGRC